VDIPEGSIDLLIAVNYDRKYGLSSIYFIHSRYLIEFRILLRSQTAAFMPAGFMKGRLGNLIALDRDIPLFFLEILAEFALCRLRYFRLALPPVSWMLGTGRLIILDPANQCGPTLTSSRLRM